MNPNRILVCPDSFKGTLTAKQAARAIADAAELVFRDAVVDLFPLADGGEGTLDCLAACGFSVVRISVRHPLNGTVNARYLYRDKTAVIESAEAIGLPLVGTDKNPLLTTSYGLGELIADAIGRGAETVFVTLGGSSTNDGGCGVAAALGYRFFDATGHEFLPTGGTLTQIDRIIPPTAFPTVAVTAWTDVDNPVCGMRGASYVYAPQKGASSADLPLLDNGLRHLCQLLDADPDTPGGGAAGGLGIGLKIFCGATLRPGIEEILRLTQFDRALDQVDLVVTGEGKFDDQSLMGKVFSGVTAHTRPRGIPVAVVAGKASPVSAEQLESAGVVLVAESDPAPDGDYRTDAYRRLRNGAARAFSQLADKSF